MLELSAAPLWTHQSVALHVLTAGELLATDLAGVGPLARVRAHVPLQDALVHGREAAVRALELLPDHREVVHCRRKRGERERERGKGRGRKVTCEIGEL